MRAPRRLFSCNLDDVCYIRKTKGRTGIKMMGLVFVVGSLFAFNSGSKGAALVTMFILLPGMILLGTVLGLLNGDNPFDNDYSFTESVGPWMLGVPLLFFLLKPKV